MDLVYAPVDGAASACFSPPVLDLPGRKLCRSPSLLQGGTFAARVCGGGFTSLTGCTEPLSTCGA